MRDGSGEVLITLTITTHESDQPQVLKLELVRPRDDEKIAKLARVLGGLEVADGDKPSKRETVDGDGLLSVQLGTLALLDSELAALASNYIVNDSAKLIQALEPLLYTTHIMPRSFRADINAYASILELIDICGAMLTTSGTASKPQACLSPENLHLHVVNIINNFLNLSNESIIMLDKIAFQTYHEKVNNLLTNLYDSTNLTTYALHRRSDLIPMIGRVEDRFNKLRKEAILKEVTVKSDHSKTLEIIDHAIKQLQIHTSQTNTDSMLESKATAIIIELKYLKNHLAAHGFDEKLPAILNSFEKCIQELMANSSEGMQTLGGELILVYQSIPGSNIASLKDDLSSLGAYAAASEIDAKLQRSPSYQTLKEPDQAAFEEPRCEDYQQNSSTSASEDDSDLDETNLQEINFFKGNSALQKLVNHIRRNPDHTLFNPTQALVSYWLAMNNSTQVNHTSIAWELENGLDNAQDIIFNLSNSSQQHSAKTRIDLSLVIAQTFQVTLGHIRCVQLSTSILQTSPEISGDLNKDKSSDPKKITADSIKKQFFEKKEQEKSDPSFTLKEDALNLIITEESIKPDSSDKPKITISILDLEQRRELRRAKMVRNLYRIINSDGDFLDKINLMQRVINTFTPWPITFWRAKERRAMRDTSARILVSTLTDAFLAGQISEMQYQLSVENQIEKLSSTEDRRSLTKFCRDLQTQRDQSAVANEEAYVRKVEAQANRVINNNSSRKIKRTLKQFIKDKSLSSPMGMPRVTLFSQKKSSDPASPEAADPSIQIEKVLQLERAICSPVC